MGDCRPRPEKSSIPGAGFDDFAQRRVALETHRWFARSLGRPDREVSRRASRWDIWRRGTPRLTATHPRRLTRDAHDPSPSPKLASAQTKAAPYNGPRNETDTPSKAAFADR